MAKKTKQMKTKKVVLYAEQLEACKEFFARALQDAGRGNPGMVLAQVVRQPDGAGYLDVGYVKPEQAIAIMKITYADDFYDVDDKTGP